MRTVFGSATNRIITASPTFGMITVGSAGGKRSDMVTSVRIGVFAVVEISPVTGRTYPAA